MYSQIMLKYHHLGANDIFIYMTLSELKVGAVCKVDYIQSEPRLRRHLYELGFVKGATVQIIDISPMHRAYLVIVQNSIFALRCEIAKKIQCYYTSVI